MTTEPDDTDEDFLGPLQRFPLLIKSWREDAEAYAKDGAALVRRRNEIVAIGAKLNLPKMKIGRSLPLDLLDRPKGPTEEEAPTEEAEAPAATEKGDAGAEVDARSELDGAAKEDAPEDITIPPTPNQNRFGRGVRK